MKEDIMPTEGNSDHLKIMRKTKEDEYKKCANELIRKRKELQRKFDDQLLELESKIDQLPSVNRSSKCPACGSNYYFQRFGIFRRKECAICENNYDQEFDNERIIDGRLEEV
jgi:hypothetical protein